MDDLFNNNQIKNTQKENKKIFDLIKKITSYSKKKIQYITGKTINSFNLTNQNLSYPIISKPLPFKIPKNITQFSNQSYKPKIYFFNQIDNNNEVPLSNSYQSATNYVGAGFLSNNHEYQQVFQALKSNHYVGVTSNQTSLLFNINFIQDPLDTALNSDAFRKDDLMVANHNLIKNVIEPLTDMPCKINKLFLFYILENLPSIIESGALPPLNNASPESIQKWVLYHRKVFVSQEKCIIFTRKNGVRFTNNKIPQGLYRKLQEGVFKDPKAAYASIQAISQKRVRTLQTAIALQNLPLYFVMQLDKRGRMYYKGEFSPLDDQFSRNLLTFSEPSLVKPKSEAEFYFFVALGKAIKTPDSFQKAFEFVVNNKKNILDTLKNFHWVTFKEPFLALNLILQFKKYNEIPEKLRKKGVLLHVKTECDASASFVQIVGSLTKNRFGAEKSNLIPPRNSSENSKSIPLQDVYQNLLVEFQKEPNRLLEEILNYMVNNLFSADKLDIDWLPEDLNFNSSPKLKDFMQNCSRSVLKTTLMTKFYGKGFRSLKEDFIKTIIKLEQQNKLNFLCEMNKDLDQNLSIIDVDSNSNIIKNEYFSKLKISVDFFYKISFKKINKNLKEIGVFSEDNSIASTPQVEGLDPLFKKEAEEISLKEGKIKYLKIKVDQERSKGTTNEQNIKISKKKKP